MDKRTFLATALEYRDKRGWNPVAIDKFKKRPWFKWEDLQESFATDRDISSWAEERSADELNIGIITGKISGITVLDIDSEEGFKAITGAGITIPETLSVTTGKGRHYYFNYTPLLKNRARYIAFTDIRNDGGLVVTPPSTHETGREYKWDNPDTPIIDFPQNLLDLLLSNVKTSPERGEAGKSLREKIAEGNRNDTLFRAACAMRSIGFEPAIIEHALTEQNRALSDPLPDHEVSIAIASALRYSIASEIRGLTDYDNACRMVDMFSQTLCYIPERKKWASWEGTHWEPRASEGIAVEKFIAMSTTIPKEIDEPGEDDVEAQKYYDARLSFARTCRNASRISAGLGITEGMLAVSELKFDQNEWLLPVGNGTIDLKTGRLRESLPGDLSIKHSEVIYDPSARADKWHEFIDRIFDGNVELIKYVQRAVGYTLTGSNRAKAFFILYGSGDNGKSVFLNVIAHVMGDFYRKASFDTFTTRGKNKNVRNDLAGLKGARIVVASETEEGERLDEALIKDITGGEPINSRFLFGEDFNYKPEFKMWFSTNHLPAVRDDSNGMWNRVKIVPFTVTIPKAEQDVHLTDKLKAEASGILNWCLEGLRMYLVDGLVEPDEVYDAVQVYREENDAFGAFLKEWLIEDTAGKIERRLAFIEFERWCAASRSYQKGMSDRKFYKKLRDRGIDEIKSTGQRYFVGYKLRDSEIVSRRDGNVVVSDF